MVDCSGWYSKIVCKDFDKCIRIQRIRLYAFFFNKGLSPFGQNRTVRFINISYYFMKVNVWENRRGNEELTIHRNWQHWVHKTQDEDKKTKNTTQYAIISRFYSLDKSTSLSVLLITFTFNVKGWSLFHKRLKSPSFYCFQTSFMCFDLLIYA